MGYKIIKTLLVPTSKDQHSQSEIIFRTDADKTTSLNHFQSPLKFYDGKLVWRSKNLKLNLLDVVSGSMAQIKLASQNSNSSRLFSEDIEKMTAFDIMVENAIKTKYPANLNKNNLNVIPSSVEAYGIEFDKKVCVCYYYL